MDEMWAKIGPLLPETAGRSERRPTMARQSRGAGRNPVDSAHACALGGPAREVSQPLHLLATVALLGRARHMAQVGRVFLVHLDLTSHFPPFGSAGSHLHQNPQLPAEPQQPLAAHPLSPASPQLHRQPPVVVGGKNLLSIAPHRHCLGVSR